MKEYNVIELSIDNIVKMVDIKEIIDSALRYHKVFFESDIDEHKKTAIIRDKFSKYFHTVPHGVAQRPLSLYSNLGKTWKRENKNISTSLTADETDDLLRFADKSNVLQAGFVVIVFDEIEWGGTAVSEGTYGYEKANFHYWEVPYLSNAVILKRDNGLGKPKLFCTVVCEAQYRNEEKLLGFIQALGGIKGECTLYAPESDEERAEWEALHQKGEKVYQAIKRCIEENSKHLPFFVTERISSYYYDENCISFDNKKIANRVLKNSTWKKCGKKHEICYEKRVGENTVTVDVGSYWKGHLLRANFFYRTSLFVFGNGEGSCFDFDPCSEEEAENYFKNLDYIFTKIDELFETEDFLQSEPDPDKTQT